MEVFNEIKAQLDRVRGQVDERLQTVFFFKIFSGWLEVLVLPGLSDVPY